MSCPRWSFISIALIHQNKFSSLAPGRCYLELVIFKLISGAFAVKLPSDECHETSLMIIVNASMLVQVMAWCRQATSHYLRQCWLRSMSPYVITRPQWVNFIHCVLLFQMCFPSTRRTVMSWWMTFSKSWWRSPLCLTPSWRTWDWRKRRPAPLWRCSYDSNRCSLLGLLLLT